MIRVSVTNIRTIRISGIETGDGITTRLLESIIREYQKGHIATMFASERTAKGPLKFNDPEYTRRKKDKRRGHKEGHLQRALDRAKLWEVRIRRRKGQPGVAYISFSERKLIERVPHYKYYRDGSTRWKKHRDGKTPAGAGVLIMTKKFAKEVQTKLREQQDEAAAGRVGKKRLKEQEREARRRSRRRRFSA